MNTDDAGDFYYDGNRLLEHHHDSATSGEDYLREYVWGLEYIDEAVAQYDTEPGQAAELFFILIDANYNVVAITDDAGDLAQQYSYWPYGTLLAAEDGTGATIDFETYPEQLATNVGHQGLYWDFESWLIHNRARTYNPELGRFMQRDPNETAQLLYTALLSNGSVAMMFDLPIGAGGQYGDGMNPYAYLRLNPVSGVDPSGLWGFEDSIDDVLSDYFVERGWVQHQTLEEAKAMGKAVAESVRQMMLMLAAQAGAQLAGDLVLPGMGEFVGLGFTMYHALEALRLFIRDPSWSSGVNLLLNIKGSWSLARSAGVRNAAARVRGSFARLRSRYTGSSLRWGSFSISHWAGYPEGVPKPKGPFRLLTGEEYKAARKAANAANKKLRQANPGRYAGKDIHEIHPVKFGGSPTDPANKIALDRAKHREVTDWWGRLQRDLEQWE